MKKLKPIVFISLVSMFFYLTAPALLTFAEQEIKLTTYYPAPYGDYKNLRARQMAVGKTYVAGNNSHYELVPIAADYKPSLIVVDNVTTNTERYFDVEADLRNYNSAIYCYKDYAGNYTGVLSGYNCALYSKTVNGGVSIWGQTDVGTGVRGEASNTTKYITVTIDKQQVQTKIPAGIGLWGKAGTCGVIGESYWTGVRGNAYGLDGLPNTGVGVVGSSETGYGIYGFVANPDSGIGVVGLGDSTTLSDDKGYPNTVPNYLRGCGIVGKGSLNSASIVGISGLTPDEISQEDKNIYMSPAKNSWAILGISKTHGICANVIGDESCFEGVVGIYSIAKNIGGDKYAYGLYSQTITDDGFGYGVVSDTTAETANGIAYGGYFTARSYSKRGGWDSTINDPHSCDNPNFINDVIAWSNVYGIYTAGDVGIYSTGDIGGIFRSTGKDGAWAICAEGTNGIRVYADAGYTGVKTIALYAENKGGMGAGWAGLFNGDVMINGHAGVEGNFMVAGSKNAMVNTQNYGDRLLYSMESPEVWFEDFGSAKLQNGEAKVAIDKVFLETVNTDVLYFVFLTPCGDTKGLFVKEKGKDYFIINETEGGQSSIQFDYRIIAKRKGFESKRLEEVARENQGE